MANIKIAQLTNQTTLSDSDTVIVESATSTNKMTVENFRNNISKTGVWIPRIEGSTTPGVHVYSKQTGVYTKIGKMVFVKFSIAVSSKDSAMNGVITIKGLPFAPDDADYPVVFSRILGFNLRPDYLTHIGYTQGVADSIVLGQLSGVTWDSLSSSAMANTATIAGSLTYMTNA